MLMLVFMLLFLNSLDAQLAVVLAPAVGDGGYVAIDVSSEEPWVSAR